MMKRTLKKRKKSDFRLKENEGYTFDIYSRMSIDLNNHLSEKRSRVQYENCC